MPIEAAPALDISAAEIKMGSAKLSDAAALTDHLRTRLATTLAAKAPVALIGPLVIRPVPGAPMKLVNTAITSALAAGDDPLLAVKRAGTWTLFRPLALPAAPVPIGIRILRRIATTSRSLPKTPCPTTRSFK
jgi:hypothetical protein